MTFAPQECVHKSAVLTLNAQTLSDRLNYLSHKQWL